MIRSDLDNGEWGVHTDGMLTSQAVHLIIDASARAGVRVQDMRFVRVRLQRQDYGISRG